MSSRREVLIRILALLQRKTLIETKNRTLKWHYWTVRSIKKCCTVEGGRGICPLFSSPPRGTCQLKSPNPRKFAIQGKKNANSRGSARGEPERRWNWLMLKAAKQNLWTCSFFFADFFAVIAWLTLSKGLFTRSHAIWSGWPVTGTNFTLGSY